MEYFVLQLQEQLDRFMKMNSELRHKQSVMQAQLKSAVERKADMEADLCEKQKEIECLATQLEKANANTVRRLCVCVCVCVCVPRLAKQQQQQQCFPPR